MNVLIGLDNEVWAKKDGKIVSAYGLVKGTKDSPHPVRNGMIQVDGMALEFGIEPATNEDQFVYRIVDVMTQLRESIPGYELDISAVAEFGEEYISSQPAEATEMGCEADFNAWTSEVNNKPESDVMRTAAGHVHIGWTQDKNIEEVRSMGEALVKQLDFFLALPSLLFDTDSKRRELYGKAGAYRAKPYGVEYRTLSNAWIKEEGLMRLVYSNIQLAVKRLTEGDVLSDKYGDIQSVINTNNTVTALAIMNEEGINYA